MTTPAPCPLWSADYQTRYMIASIRCRHHEVVTPNDEKAKQCADAFKPLSQLKKGQ